KPSTHIYRVKKAISWLTGLYGRERISRFGPVALQALRKRLIDSNVARSTINSLVGCVVRIFKWGAANEMVSGDQYHALAAVESLRAGRSDARETAPVLPVPEDDLKKVRAKVWPMIRDLLDLQLLSAARPGELLRLRPAGRRPGPRPAVGRRGASAARRRPPDLRHRRHADPALWAEGRGCRRPPQPVAGPGGRPVRLRPRLGDVGLAGPPPGLGQRRP